MSEYSDYLIVGAGLSGMSLASLLAQETVSVTLLEKARGTGGRLSRWKSENLGSDFLPAHPLLVELGLMSSEQYEHSTPLQGRPLNKNLKLLLEQKKDLIDFRSQHHVNSLERNNGLWLVETQEKKQFSTKRLLLCLPMPQAQALLKEIEISWPETTYKAQVTLFTENLSQLLETQALKLLKLENNLYKVILSAESQVFPERSELTQEEYNDFFEKSYQVKVLRAHFWRYARADAQTSFSQLYFPDLNLGFCSDWVAPGENLITAMDAVLCLKQQLP